MFNLFVKYFIAWWPVISKLATLIPQERAPPIIVPKNGNNFKRSTATPENLSAALAHKIPILDGDEKFNSLRVISATEKTEGEYVTYTCLDNNGEKLYLKVNLYNPFEYYIELSNIAF